jgi:hypothetical protein
VGWNAIYMQEAIRQVRSDGMDVSNDDIARLSPLIWRRLNFLGRYDFSLPDTVMNGDFRPLRNPTSAWHFSNGQMMPVFCSSPPHRPFETVLDRGE